MSNLTTQQTADLQTLALLNQLNRQLKGTKIDLRDALSSKDEHEIEILTGDVEYLEAQIKSLEIELSTEI